MSVCFSVLVAPWVADLPRWYNKTKGELSHVSWPKLDRVGPLYIIKKINVTCHTLHITDSFRAKVTPDRGYMTGDTLQVTRDT